MNFQSLIIVAGIIFILIFLAILFFSPTEGHVSRKEKKRLAQEQVKQKDWEKQALHLTAEVKALREDITQLKKVAQNKDKELAVEKLKSEKLWEKLKQERQWHEKEQERIDAGSGELKKTKQELLKTQEQFSCEHSLVLRLEGEVKSLKHELEQGSHQRRSLEAEGAQLKAKIENYRQEIAQLKKQTIELAQKKDEASWIARSEYDRVVKLLKEKEKR